MAETPLQNASGSGIAQAYGDGASATVNLTGFGPEEIAVLLKAAGFAQQTRVDELAKQMDVSRGALLGFFKILKEDEVPLEQLGAKLELVAQRHNDLLVRLGALDPGDDEAGALIDRAREVIRDASSSADYDRADDLLFQAEEAQDKTIAGAETLEREAHEVAGRLRVNKANTRAERAALSLTRLDYLQAAKHFEIASKIIAVDHPALRLNYVLLSANALQSHGKERGDNEVLALAIDSFRNALSLVTRDSLPSEWGNPVQPGKRSFYTWRKGERDGTTRRGCCCLS